MKERVPWSSFIYIYSGDARRGEKVVRSLVEQKRAGNLVKNGRFFLFLFLVFFCFYLWCCFLLFFNIFHSDRDVAKCKYRYDMSVVLSSVLYLL